MRARRASERAMTGSEATTTRTDQHTDQGRAAGQQERHRRTHDGKPCEQERPSSERASERRHDSDATAATRRHGPNEQEHAHRATRGATNTARAPDKQETAGRQASESGQAERASDERATHSTMTATRQQRRATNGGDDGGRLPGPSGAFWRSPDRDWGKSASPGKEMIAHGRTRGKK